MNNLRASPEVSKGVYQVNKLVFDQRIEIINHILTMDSVLNLAALKSALPEYNQQHEG